MVDNRSPQSRSALMGRVGSRHTAPELRVRRLLHSMGYRFRLHRRDLPGKPDIVLPSRRKIVLVHGCFWHAHGCKIGRPPKSREDFWRPKLDRNRERDLATEIALKGLGWEVLTVWQCETREEAALAARLAAFLGPPGAKFRSTSRP